MADAVTNKARKTKPKWLRLRYCCVTIVLLAVLGITGILPVYRDHVEAYFQITKVEFGLLMTIGSVVGIAGALAGGILVDRGGPRQVLRIGLVGCAAGLALAACPGPWTILMAALGIVALFAGPVNIAVQAYLVNLFPDNRRRVLTLSMVGQAAGWMGFSLLAEKMLALTRQTPPVPFGQVFRVPYAIVAAILLAGALLYGRRKSLARLVAAALPNPRPAKAPLNLGSALLVALMVIHGTCDSAIYNWMPTVLGGKSFVHQTFLPGVVMAGFGLAYIISRGVLSLMPERFGVRAMMIAPGIVGGSLFLVGLLSGSQFWTSICYVMGAFCWSVEYPAMLACLASDSKRFGSALAIFTVMQGLATFALTPLMGAVGEKLGDSALWQVLLIPAVGFPLVGLGGAIWVWKFSRSAAQAA